MATRSPFPGMDPWLEQYWPSLHARFITYAVDQLAEQLPDDLIPAIEETVYVVEPEWDRGRARPDVGVFGPAAPGSAPPATASGVSVAEPVRIRLPEQPVVIRHVEIRDSRQNHPLITAIEVLSPTNKLDPRGRRAYIAKRQSYYDAGANVVEIDLLRGGAALIDVPMDALAPALATPYKACARRRPATEDVELEVEYYPLPLRQRLPAIRIPLRPTDEDVALDLQRPIDLAYERGRYAMRIDYSRLPEPPLEAQDAAWASEQLRRWERGS
jgi:hypothetical protein